MRSRRRRRRKPSPWRQIGVYVFVGVLAIICGWVINTLLVQGYLWAPSIPKVDPVNEGPQDPVPEDPVPEDPGSLPQPSEQTAQISLRSARLYLTQIAAVENKGGADALIAKLREQGYAGAYHYDGKLYRVFAGIFADKAAADALGQMLKASQIDSFTKELSWPASEATISGAYATYFDDVQPALKAIEKVFFDLLDTKGFDQSTLAHLQSSMQEASNVLSQANPDKALESLHADLLTACTQLQEAVRAVEQFMTTGDDQSRIASESHLITVARCFHNITNTINNLFE
ncbi:MAG: SPOR domain-containing protein [Firmicutes bacterium]|nr:SPOR domain-containing protein [Bacillota bacterium]